MQRFAGTLFVFAVALTAAGLILNPELVVPYSADWAATAFGTFLAVLGGLFIGGTTHEERSKAHGRSPVIWGAGASLALALAVSIAQPMVPAAQDRSPLVDSGLVLFGTAAGVVLRLFLQTVLVRRRTLRRG